MTEEAKTTSLFYALHIRACGSGKTVTIRIGPFKVTA